MILYIAGAVAVPLCLASYIASMRWLRIKHEVFHTDKDVSLKILHISDFHAKSLKRTDERMWEKIHALDFDMTAITGDLLQWRIGELEPIRPHLERLVARAPVFFVDGNHERRIHAEVYRALGRIGIIGLENRRVKVEINGMELDIVGVADFYRLRKEKFRPVRKAFAKGRNDAERFTLVLSHQPSIIDKIGGYSADLMLCGHTHGGQVRIPFLPAIYAPEQGLFPRFDHGRYRVGDTDIYISKGIGATHFNIRLFNRPEVAVVEVRPYKHTRAICYG